MDKEPPKVTGDATSSHGHVRAAFVELLAAVGIAVIVAAAAWIGWVYFLDPVDGDPTDAKTFAYVVALVVATGSAALMTRVVWVGLLAPFAMAHAVLWGAAQDVVPTDGLEGVGAELAAWGAFLPALLVGVLGVVVRLHGSGLRIVRGRDVGAVVGCVVAGRILMSLAP